MAAGRCSTSAIRSRHAIEAECGYGAVLHGEAVAVGLGLAFRLSAALGYCGRDVAERVEGHLAAMGLPADLGDVEPAVLGGASDRR